MPQSERASLARRAFLALMLFVGFYALAFVMMGLLVLIGFLDIASGHFHFQILIVLLIGFGAILFSIIPRPDRFETPWPRMTAEQHPDLFARIESIAARAGQRMPDEVYLLPDLNAWVMDRGRGGRRRVMGIGLPLIYLLDIPQFTAVVAHEFGHYYGGDTRLGPWIYKTHATIGRTLQSLNENSIRIIEAPFRAYANLFLRVSRSVSREQEYTADRFAASMVGPEAVATSLKRLAAYDAPVGIYWNQLVMPTLGSGYRPDIIGGLTLIHFSKDVAETAHKVAEKIIAEGVEDPFDTHPCLRDRIAALKDLPPVEIVETAADPDSDSALTLLGELLPVENQLLGMFVTEDALAQLTPIEWGDVGERVFVSHWKKLRDHNRELLESWTVDEMGALFYAGTVLVSEARTSAGKYVDPEKQPALFYAVALACVSLAAIDAGWTFLARPDLGLGFTRGDGEWDPEYALSAVASGQVSQKVWTDVCKDTGISGMLMTGGLSPTGPGTRWGAVNTGVPVADEPTDTGLRYEGGNGATIDTAIIILGARAETEVIHAELHRLRDWYGKLGEDWYKVNQEHTQFRDREIDVIDIVFKNGQKRTLYFDVTEWWGRKAEPGQDATGA